MEVSPMHKKDYLYIYPNRANGIWSTPDGQNVKDKLTSALNLGIYISVPATILLHTALGANVNSPALFGRLVLVGVPICGTCLLFASTQYISAKIRGKSDAWNTAFAALSTMPVIRRFLPWSHALPQLAAMVTGTLVFRLANGYGSKTLEQSQPLYMRDGMSLNWYSVMQRKPPGEPYIKFKNPGFFFEKL